ncbi:MAG: class I SAM-dependent methyltransferase, partial [Bacteroidota bacterium]
MPPSPYQGEADFHDVFYDTAADHIYASYAYSLVKQRNTDFVLRNIADPTTKTVISLGCGNGAFECSLSPHFQQIIGVDLSTRAIELARQRQVERGLTNLTFRVGNARTIDAPDQSVDAILVISTFHHLSEDDLANLMREAYRVLRPGG